MRAQMTRAGITSRLIIDQMAALTNDTYAGKGPMDQLQFAQVNASGLDHMAGPRWPWRMEDNIHHCSEDAVRDGEVQGSGDVSPDTLGSVGAALDEGCRLSERQCRALCDQPTASDRGQPADGG